MSEELIVERHGHVALMRLNRPERLNALSLPFADEIAETCHALEAEDDVRALVIIGEGRGFSAGADLGQSVQRDQIPPQCQRLDEMGWVGKLAIAIYEMTKPTIAAVNGVAAGAGMSLALGCDIRIGSPAARFKTVFLERALSPDAGMTFFLPRIVGYPRAADLIFSSRSIDADEAYRIGLLDRVVSAETLQEAALEAAQGYAKQPPLAIRAAKRTLQRNLQRDFREALLGERLGLFYARLAPNDAAESMNSWREKRDATYTGT